MKMCEGKKYLMPENEHDLEFVKSHGYKQMTGVNYCWWQENPMVIV